MANNMPNIPPPTQSKRPCKRCGGPRSNGAVEFCRKCYCHRTLLTPFPSPPCGCCVTGQASDIDPLVFEKVLERIAEQLTGCRSLLDQLSIKVAWTQDSLKQAFAILKRSIT